MKIIMGRFGRPVGIRGQIKLFVFSRAPQQIMDYQPWFVKNQDGQWREINIKHCSQKDKFLIVQLEGYDSREAVQALTNKELAVNQSALPELPKDEYYWNDLIGLTVINQQQVTLGVVTDLMETGSNDVLVVESKDKTHLLPFIFGEFIKEIDTSQKQMQVDWDEEF